MLKNILKIEGIQKLNKNEQKNSRSQSNDTKIEKPKLDVFENKMVCGRTYKTAI